MRNTQGTVVYTIEHDGCLTGLYRNEGNPDKQYNEIARKKISTSDTDIMVGRYISSWIDIDDSVKIGELIITEEDNKYKLLWLVDGKPVYQGSGTITASNQLTATFANVP